MSEILGWVLNKVWTDLGAQSSRNVNNQYGQLQIVIKRDSSGNQNIYNSLGQLQGYVKKRDSSGNQNIYNSLGQLQGSIRPNGAIMNQLGQEIGRIKP